MKKKWIITGLVALALGTLWFSFYWWLSNVFSFLAAHKTGIDAAMAILVPVGSALGFLIGKWLDRRDKQAPSGSASVNQTVVTNVYSAASAAPTSTPVHQLPPPRKPFVGRLEEIGELMEAVGTAGVTVCGVVGLGGVGKTELALTLAEHL